MIRHVVVNKMTATYENIIHQYAIEQYICVKQPWYHSVCIQMGWTIICGEKRQSAINKFHKLKNKVINLLYCEIVQLLSV